MKSLKLLLSALGIALLVLLIWGLLEPYFIDVEEHRVEIPNLPHDWEGLGFAQISDWQLGMWLDNDYTVRRCIESLIERRPAFVVISGDFVYHAGAHPDRLIQKAADLAGRLPEAGIPTIAVLGNHDYAMRTESGVPDETLARNLAAALEGAGVIVLQNEARAVTPGDASGSELYVVGLGAHWPGLDDVDAALASVPNDAARIAVMHNPATFKALPPASAPLAVAGHTHGGQISIPFTPDWSYLTYLGPDIPADGWATENYGRKGNRLYVNRGIGFSNVPLRIHCMPEITFFTLAAAVS